MLALGLKIKTSSGETFDVWGVVTYKTFPVDGRIYYCAGLSYPEACVVEVYTVNQTAEELYKLAMKEKVK